MLTEVLIFLTVNIMRIGMHNNLKAVTVNDD